MIITKYTWRELTFTGSLKPIKIKYDKFFNDTFDTEEEAIEAFSKEFGSEYNYNYPSYVLVKVYGSDN